MAWVALALYLLGVATVGGLRTWLHYRATGDSGHRLRPRSGTAEWWAWVLMAAALLLGAIAPILAATAVIGPIALFDHPIIAVAGLVVAVAGFVGVLAAQQAMGASWRVGVDPTERTELVTGGVFARIRNPIFTAMITASVGLTAMVPTWPQLLGLACLVAGFQIQVRTVEEPYLTRTHGTTYIAYTQRTGRFLPRISRLQRAGPTGRRPAGSGRRAGTDERFGR
jgi:protein-S-isoprenylcysteine O-methyltransferase Ste14